MAVSFPREDSQNPVDHRLMVHLKYSTAEYRSRLVPNARIRPPMKSARMRCAIVDAGMGTGR
jgi:hypothetical protein